MVTIQAPCERRRGRHPGHNDRRDGQTADKQNTLRSAFHRGISSLREPWAQALIPGLVALVMQIVHRWLIGCFPLPVLGARMQARRREHPRSMARSGQLVAIGEDSSVSRQCPVNEVLRPSTPHQHVPYSYVMRTGPPLPWIPAGLAVIEMQPITQRGPKPAR